MFGFGLQPELLRVRSGGPSSQEIKKEIEKEKEHE